MEIIIIIAQLMPESAVSDLTFLKNFLWHVYNLTLISYSLPIDRFIQQKLPCFTHWTPFIAHLTRVDQPF